MMENKSFGKRRMGINYKGSQGQTKTAIVIYEEEDTHTLQLTSELHTVKSMFSTWVTLLKSTTQSKII
jgi:hypothetical protein